MLRSDTVGGNRSARSGRACLSGVCRVPSGRTMSTLLSPAQAAHVAQVSRRTITRAISAQALRATRDNKNQWRIRAEDLEAWRAAQTAHWAPTAQAQEDAHFDDDLRMEAAGLRVEVRSLRERLTDLEQKLTEEKEARRLAEERHHAQVLALAQRTAPEKLQEAPNAAPAGWEPPKAPKSFLARLLGRG